MKNLTLHILNTIPYSNLNRDDTGTPKRARIGGSVRGLLSSQSIKRGARDRYELTSGDQSFRSTIFIDELVKESKRLLEEAGTPADAKQEKALLTGAKKLISGLTKAESESDAKKKAADSEADSSKAAIWLSREEFDAAAAGLAGRAVPYFLNGNRTGSLSIAAFGRMFANSPATNTEAAVAVSPAISVHPAVIESDYFVTKDDLKTTTGAAYLDSNSFTSGVFYRTVTIDREQLATSWTAYSSDDAADKIRTFVESLVYGLPTGKKNSSAPYVAPLAILAEEQGHRLAYDFETPVAVGENGGYAENALAALLAKQTEAHNFHPSNFGLVAAAGTMPGSEGPLDALVDAVSAWVVSK